MFGDVRLVCVGGSSVRMEHFTQLIAAELKADIPVGMGIKNISSTDRCVVGMKRWPSKLFFEPVSVDLPRCI